MKNTITYLFIVLFLLFMPGSSSGSVQDELELKVYPNPSRGEFTLSLEKDEGQELSARIYNVTGKLILDLEKKISDEDGKVMLKVDLRDSGSGIYFLRIESEEERITRKIIVE